MASPQETLDLLILVGNTLTIDKQFIVGVVCLWFYDYIITLPDEIRCAWPGRKSPVFVLFLLNRYWPLLYLIWLSVATWCPGYTKSMCDKTAWLHSFYYMFATLFAQAAITLRVYAVTGKNRWIGACLCSVSFVEFVFGIYLAIRFSLQPALQFPPIPLDTFQLCIFQRWRPGETASTVLSLVYDSLAFFIIVFSSKRRDPGRAYGVPNLLDRIVKDATMYFLVIFTSHLLLIFFEFLAPESMQLLPASANSVLVPIMVTRLIVSLKRAATTTDTAWSFDDGIRREGIRFASQTICGTGRGEGSIAMKYITSKGFSSLPEP